jgi:hypothetical protein
MPLSAIHSGFIAGRNAKVYNAAKSKYDGIALSPLINRQQNGNKGATPAFGFSLTF